MTSAPKPPPAPRLTARGASRRDRILDAATALFLDQGYEAVTVDEIIRAVGGSKTNLYKQFGGKEGLFGEIVERLCAGFLMTMEGIEAGSLRAEDGLRVLAGTLMRILLEDRHVAFQRLMLAVSGRFPALAARWFDSGPERSRRLVGRFIALKQQGGEIGPGDPHLLATQFHDMVVTNALYLALIGRPPEWADVAAGIDEAIETLMRGRPPA